MGRCVAFVVSGIASHVHSTLGLARELSARGWSVEYWSEGSARRLIQSHGFTHQEIEPIWLCHERMLPLSWGDLVSRMRSSIERRRALADAVRQFEQALDEQLERRVPDLVILDPLVVTYFPLLRMRELDCVVLQDKPVPAPDPLVPPPTSALLPRKSAMGRARVWFRWKVERGSDALRRAGRRAFGLVGGYTAGHLIEAIVARTGDPPGTARPISRVSYDLHFAELEEWVLGLPDADLPRQSPLPPRTRYVGAWVDERRGTGVSPIRRASGTSQLIYVSMGVTMPHWSADVSILRRIIDAFGGMPGFQLVISTGNPKARTALVNAHPNVQLFIYLPQVRVLQDVDLAIVHGGANAFRECIATGTPMLAFPREFDQPGNAARIVYHGLGLRGSRRFATSASIRADALRILEDRRYRSRVRALNEISLNTQSKLLDLALGTREGRLARRYA